MTAIIAQMNAGRAGALSCCLHTPAQGRRADTVGFSNMEPSNWLCVLRVLLNTYRGFGLGLFIQITSASPEILAGVWQGSSSFAHRLFPLPIHFLTQLSNPSNVSGSDNQNANRKVS